MSPSPLGGTPSTSIRIGTLSSPTFSTLRTTGTSDLLSREPSSSPGAVELASSGPACSLVRRRAPVEALEPVVRQRLPRARALHALVVRRPDAVPRIERAEPHGPVLSRAVVAEQRAPARGAEELR